jgi:CRP/FNR family transcriptional regulator
MRSIDKGEELNFLNDDKQIVFFLKAGTIKIVDAESNRTMHLVKKGNLFGEIALIADGDQEKAIAIEDGVICFIDADQMKMMMENHASLKNGVLKLSGIRIKRLQNQVKDLIYKDSETRIREYIFRYVEEFGEMTDGIKQAKNLLTHSDIAHLTNTSRQTVSNVLSKLRKEGIINYDSKKIQVYNP